ncbi:MAG: GGDEF domain-containing protein [Candidatus Aenigmarchaeota archaeon]|nr:GGDEF domain-containing protein [Candidatus Aenigmarchaeota archaeon]
MGFEIVHKIYENGHNRMGLTEALKESGLYGAIILDNGHHGYGYVNGEIKDFASEEIPYREIIVSVIKKDNVQDNGKGDNVIKIEINDGCKIIEAIPIIGEHGIAAILYTTKEQTGSNEDILRSAITSLKIYDEFRNSKERDPKFGIYNKNYVMESKHSNPYGLLMLDLDKFKSINDTYGHEAGDEVLKAFVEMINGILPEGAILARYGGEEFTVVVENASTDKLYELANRINIIMRNLTVRYKDEEIKVTVSIGGGVYSPNTSIKDALEDADKRLYESKNGGRDRATINRTII